MAKAAGMNLKALALLLREALRDWSRDKASRMAAALAYYTVFSLAPFLIIALTLGAAVLGDSAVQGELERQIEGLVGADVAQIIQTMVLATINRPSSGIITTALGVVTLWWAASNLFGQVQQALNSIWGVPPRSARGLLGYMWGRFLAVVMVVGMGVLLIFSITLLAVISALNHTLADIVPNFVRLAPLVDWGFTLLLLTLSFGAVYHLLPNTSVGWRDVGIGAFFTAVLLALGKYLIGLYLGNAGIQSTYGAAGSLVVLLVWVYYSAQIFLFGAEFTKVYARAYGSHRPRSPRPAAVDSVVAQTGEVAWPALQPRPQERRAAPLNAGVWLAAGIAFFVGLLVGARKGR